MPAYQFPDIPFKDHVKETVEYIEEQKKIAESNAQSLQFCLTNNGSETEEVKLFGGFGDIFSSTLTVQSYINNGNDIAVGSTPFDISYNPHNNYIYVSNAVGDSLQIIDQDGVTQNTITSLNEVRESRHNNVNEDMYVCVRQDNEIKRVDSDTLLVTATISMSGQPTDLDFNVSNQKYYISCQGDDTVKMIDPSTDAIVGSSISVGTTPRGIAYNPVTTKIYVANRDDDTVSIINTGTDTVESTISVGNRPVGVTYAPSSDSVYVANNLDSTVSVIDENNLISETIALGGGSGPVKLIYNSSNKTIVVANASGDSVRFIDVDPTSDTFHTVIQTISIGNSPFGVAFAADTNNIFATNSSDNDVSVLIPVISEVVTSSENYEQIVLEASRNPLTIEGVKVIPGNADQALTTMTVNYESYGGTTIADNIPLSQYKSASDNITVQEIDELKNIVITGNSSITVQVAPGTSVCIIFAVNKNPLYDEVAQQIIAGNASPIVDVIESCEIGDAGGYQWEREKSIEGLMERVEALKDGKTYSCFTSGLEVLMDRLEYLKAQNGR